MCPLSVAVFERFTVCSAKMAEPIDGKASNRLRYTLSVLESQKTVTPFSAAVQLRVKGEAMPLVWISALTVVIG